MKYHFSPKVVIIAGPPAGGKSYAAQMLADDFGYAQIRLDAITPTVAQKYGGDIETVRHPKTYLDFKNNFIQILRTLRYQDIVFEGCRISHPHIHQAFLDALCDMYSPYTIRQSFYLKPARDVRMERFLLRTIRQTKQAIKTGSQPHQPGQFCEMLEPVLPDFKEVQDSDVIGEWAEANRKTTHPGIAVEDRDIFKTIAEADSFNPFYQTIESNGRVLVPGFTQSPLTWKNMLKLGVNFTGKTLCDYGCMHGYYTFKAEEMGAHGTGMDMDQGAISLSTNLATAKRSNCQFMVYDITTPLPQKYDIILALNVLHRTGKFELTTKIMFEHCNETILEVGESQLPVILGEGTRQGFSLASNLPSHRYQSCIGPRRVLHMVRQETHQ
ncbi:methyltransferase domain-containing protein [Pseudodesulfovibrio sp. JC047]|uniref:methyltransferase domain-containing protein n=1 Tax=Pseudodesulfovibrio sp. JC047 TaxID=2683199 RepID=UPI0013D20D2F|nr:methyltransferase domain-containing protein [Pseudodesulfovibrio sp. JC047]NDV18538.1 methyltransferase domain-containing protein [Pseudodesulfovibrio sp. JC047]